LMAFGPPGLPSPIVRMSFLAIIFPMSRENGIDPRRKPPNVQKRKSNMRTSFGKDLLLVKTQSGRLDAAREKEIAENNQ
jgi:hypothetical protein